MPLKAPLPIPDELGRRARIVGNGESFWPLGVASAVATALAAAGLAICGGEVYVARGRAWGNMEFEWLTDPAPDEIDPGRALAWRTHVERGLSQALTALDEVRMEYGARGDEDGADDATGLAEPMCFFALRSEEEHRSPRTAG